MAISVVGTIPVWRPGYEWVEEEDLQSMLKQGKGGDMSQGTTRFVLWPVGRAHRPKLVFPPPPEPLPEHSFTGDHLARLREATEQMVKENEAMIAHWQDISTYHSFPAWWEDAANCRCYDLFREEPALYRIFADLDGSMAAILSFANAYGMLHARWLGDDPTRTVNETPSKWQMAIEEMRDAIALWDCYVAGNRKAIEKQRAAVVAKRRWARLRTEPEPRNYCELSAVELLGRAVHIHCYYDSRLQLVRSHNGSVSINMTIAELQPSLWIQFAIAMAERKEYRRCEQCGRPFLLSPEENRADRVYHSNSCRVKAYRLRKAKAIKLRAAGQPLRTIVKELDSDLATIKKWLGEDK